MYAITGITGQVGGETARNLLAAKQPVRAILRDAAKAAPWKAQGCDIALADISDAPALARAFADASGVFILLPSSFDPSPGFPEVRKTIAAIKSALLEARPKKVVCISTIGAQAKQPNLLNQLGHMEQSFADLPMPVAFLRPAWFMENFAWDVAPAKEKGVMPSFLQPLDKKFPMIATADIGRVAAKLLQEQWTGKRVVELEGSHRITPNEVAATFAKILGKPVRPEIVPHDTWEPLFRCQGMKNPTPRIQMLDGFNQGWIEFENRGDGIQKGTVELETVLQKLVAQTGLS